MRALDAKNRLEEAKAASADDKKEEEKKFSIRKPHFLN